MLLINGKASRFIVLMGLFQLSIVISTAFNPLSYAGTVKSSLTDAVSNVAICIIAENGLKSSPRKFLKIFAGYGMFMCVIAACTMLIYYPNGMDQKQYMDIRGDVNFYFLGHDNKSYFIFIAVQCAVILFSLITYNKISGAAVIFNLIVTVAFFHVRSLAAMVCILLIWIYLLILLKKDVSKLLNFKNYYLVFLMLFLFVVVLNTQTFFSAFFNIVLKKGMTISGRTIIWEKAFAYIKKSPFIGYGYEPTNVLMLKFGINHVHNIVLDVIYRSGVTGGVIYAAVIVLCGKELMRYKTEPVAAFVSFMFFAFLLAASFDYYNNIPYCTAIYAFAANIKYLINAEYPKEKISNNLQTE